MQPQRRHHADGAESDDWLGRMIREKVANGNKPDFEAARRAFDRLHRSVRQSNREQLSGDQIDDLIDRVCGRRDVAGWPLIRIDEETFVVVRRP